jgi:type I restriction enzyme S subunit
MGAVCRVVGGGTPKTAVPGNFADDGGHPWLTPADLTGYRDKLIGRGRRNLTDQGLAGSSATYMPAGTVLFSSRAPIGYVVIAANPITTNQGFRSFVPSEALDSDYGYYYLKSITEVAERLASGTTFNELSGSKAKTLPLLLPPLAEQRRIAARLDAIQERRATTVGHLQNAGLIAERLRSAVLAAACTGRLTSDWREDNPDATADELLARLTSIPRKSTKGRKGGEFGHGLTSEAQLALLPDTWSLARLGDIADVATGATPLRNNRAYYDGGAIPWITSGAVNDGTITTPTELITPLALAETNVKLFPPGTLLVAMYGEGQTRGRVAELAIEAGTNQAVAAVLFGDDNAALQPFIRLFFEESYQRVRALSVGGVQPNLNLGMIKDTLIPLPPLDEQQEIMSRADAMVATAERLSAQITRARAALDRASQASLSKALRGELVPTEATLAASDNRGYEAGDVLLARVRALSETTQPRGRGTARREP